MVKAIKWAMLFFLLAAPLCLAEETVTTKDGQQVLLKDDHTWEYVNNQNMETSPKPINAKYAEEAVGVWNTSLSLGEHNYSNAVFLYIDYKNNTDKRVVGVTVYVNITNPFGKVAYENTIDDEVDVQPLEKLKNKTYWYFEDNQFINDEPYDKLWQMAQKGTAKITTKILKVIFEDGTVLKNKPTQIQQPTSKPKK